MKAAITGRSSNPFVKALIDSLDKEGWEIYLISGPADEEKKNQKIFETYRFEYDDENLMFVLDGISPDVVIFTGSSDDRYRWDRLPKTSSSFLSGLSNLLYCARKAGVRKFVYLSSAELYGDGPVRETAGMTEESPVAPVSDREMTFWLGENLVRQYDGLEEFTSLILRMGEVYGFPKTSLNGADICQQLCTRALEEQPLSIHPDRLHNLICLPDAVNAVYRVTASSYQEHRLYNITDGRTITEQELAELVEDAAGRPLHLNPSEENGSGGCLVSNERFAQEFDYRPKYEIPDSVLRLFDVLGSESRKRRKQEERDKEDHLLLSMWRKAGLSFSEKMKQVGKVLKPFLETLIFFLLIQLVSVWMIRSGFGSSFDFYLLYVVLVSLMYGKKQSVFAMLYSIAGRVLSLRNGSAGLSMFEIFSGYEMYLWVLQILTIGISVGFLRDRFRQNITELREENIYLQSEVEEIKKINETNSKIKKVYEHRLLTYKDSLGRIFAITSKLDDMEPSKVVYASAEIISDLMGSKAVSIYSVGENSYYARLAAVTSGLNVKKSIKLDSVEELYEAVSQRKIYANRTMREDRPVFAGGVFDGNRLSMIVMIWSMDLEKINQYQMNLFSILLSLIAQAMTRAIQYIEGSEAIRFLPGTKILAPEVFERVVRVHQEGKGGALTDYCLLRVKKEGRSLRELSEKLLKGLRAADYMGVDDEEELYVLATNTSADEAEVIIRRFGETGIVLERGGNPFE